MRISMFYICMFVDAPVQKQNIWSVYLHGTDAVLDESLDTVILGLLQNLIQFFVVLWKWYWAVSQEVQNQGKMSATSVQNYPTWDSGENDFQ